MECSAEISEAGRRGWRLHHQSAPYLRAAGQYTLRCASFIEELSPQAEPRRSPWSKAQLDQPALADESLVAEIPAVLPRHDPFDAFEDIGADTSVVPELLGAVFHRDAGAFADVFVMGTLVGVLDPAPTADVVDEDNGEVGAPWPHIIQQPLQRVAACDTEAAFAVIRVGLSKLDATSLGVFPDRVGLGLGGVALMVG
jgi:hypothetical protein